MKRITLCSILSLVLVTSLIQSPATADILFESGTLGPTGIPRGVVPGANVSASVFDGVRFQLTVPVVTTQVGGHFVGSPGTTDTFFGAIIALESANDFPDSGDLSTPDVLGSTMLAFPDPSAEVFGNLALSLDTGWYALVFGSGLFDAAGDGAAPLNNPDIGTQSYIAFVSSHWKNSAPTDGFEFKDYRFVIKGSIVPEPSSLCLLMLILSSYFTYRQTRFKHEFYQ